MAGAPLLRLLHHSMFCVQVWRACHCFSLIIILIIIIIIIIMCVTLYEAGTLDSLDSRVNIYQSTQSSCR